MQIPLLLRQEKEAVAMKAFVSTSNNLKLKVFYNDVPQYEIIPQEIINIIVNDTIDQTRESIKKQFDKTDDKN